MLSCVGTSLQLRGSSVAKEAPKKLEVYVDDTLVLCEPGTTLLQVRLPSTLSTLMSYSEARRTKQLQRQIGVLVPPPPPPPV